jgi:hypothetical protein
MLSSDEVAGVVDAYRHDATEKLLLRVRSRLGLLGSKDDRSL